MDDILEKLETFEISDKCTNCWDNCVGSGCDVLYDAVKKTISDLRCCGNCKHLDPTGGYFGMTCGFTKSTLHPSGEYVVRSLLACDKWEHNK